MKFAFSSNAFRKYSLIDTIEILADTGYEGIEIMADSPHAYPPDLQDSDIHAIRSALNRNHMEISNINSFMLWAEGDTWHPSWIEKDPALRERRVQHTRNCIELAAELGARTISTEPGGPLEGFTAREKNVRVLIEPEPDLLIENSRQFLSLYNELDKDIFGLNFDIGHFFCVNENPAELISELQDCSYHYHLEDIAENRVHHHLLPGAGSIDLHRVLKEIDHTGYPGFVTVELYPYEEQPAKTAEKALTYLKQLSSS